ncbi:hypothetical protein [Halodurantibacterium flavum]|uniref:Uncharacterized protein n=1 Tax=Halodurantibacterium flavum TaxID=1382802 RepID=A0ABW4S0Y1_9RHOB
MLRLYHALGDSAAKAAAAQLRALSGMLAAPGGKPEERDGTGSP